MGEVVHARLRVSQSYLSEGTIRYARVLGHHMLASALDSEGSAFIFQQVNASCHEARKVTNPWH